MTVSQSFHNSFHSRNDTSAQKEAENPEESDNSALQTHANSVSINEYAIFLSNGIQKAGEG
jgi:hypothetical protein